MREQIEVTAEKILTLKTRKNIHIKWRMLLRNKFIMGC